ncbi:hypothetical protein D018_0452B, partial [Vibrio parahaemolyticus VP2007-007]
KIIVCIAIHG